MTIRKLAYPVWMMVLLLIAGCKPSIVEIKGVITKKGAPLIVEQKMVVTLVFTPDVAKADRTYPAFFNNETGQFSVEMPPGKYKCNLLIVDHSKRPMFVLPINPAFSKKSFDLNSSESMNLEIEP